MRDLSVNTLAALAKGQLKSRFFFIITARNLTTNNPETARFWNDLMPFPAAINNPDTGLSETYIFTGSGTLITCGDIVLTNDLSVRTLSVTLNQTNTDINNYIRGYDLRNAAASIYRGLFDAGTYTLVDPAEAHFVGFVGKCQINTPTPGQGGSVNLELFSHTRALTRTSPERRSHESQLRRKSGDNFFKYASIIGQVPIFWGQSKGVAPASAASSSSSVNAADYYSPAAIAARRAAPGGYG